jgi:hypothetical protein
MSDVLAILSKKPQSITRIFMFMTTVNPRLLHVSSPPECVCLFATTSQYVDLTRSFHEQVKG